jgi:anti-sigma B factor antagonist
MPSGFSVVARDEEQVRTVAVRGDLDVATCEEFVDALGGLDGVDALVLDLSAVTFMDSSGIRGLLIARRDAQAGGTRLQILASEAVRETLEVTGLDDDLPLAAAA